MVKFSNLGKGAILVSLPVVLPMMPVKIGSATPVAPQVHASPTAGFQWQSLFKPLREKINDSVEKVMAGTALTKETGSCACHQAAALYDKGEYARAAYYYRKAGTLMATEYGANSSEVASMRYNEGRCFHELSKYPTAVALYKQALGIYKTKDPVKYRSEVAWAYWAIGSSQTNLQSFPEATVAFNKAIEQYKILGPSKEQGDCLEAFADCYSRQGLKSKADAMLAQARSMQKST